MKLIKLDAIDSTNNFLKGLAREQKMPNLTVVTAEEQTNGKGQMGSQWYSAYGKNIIMSILINDFLRDLDDIFDLNIVISLSIIEALKGYSIPDLSIKWPNDIMSGNKKIGGVLIENIIKSDGIYSVVGLGLNVNQSSFENLPNASSLSIITNKIFNREELQQDIFKNIISTVQAWKKNTVSLKKLYEKNLYKNGAVMPFQSPDNAIFFGRIEGVSKEGKLQISLYDKLIFLEFNTKEIQLLY